MTINIDLVIPITPDQILTILLFVIIIMGLLTSIMTKNILGISIFFIMLVAMIFYCIIVPTIMFVMPNLPPVWQEKAYEIIHPETWFNISIAWSK